MSKGDCIKLVLCPRCHDVFKLQSKTRACLCRLSGGRYLEDGLNAEVWGEAVPIGFFNPSLVSAVRNRPEGGQGTRFTAFVIPKVCATVRVTPRPDPDA